MARLRKNLQAKMASLSALGAGALIAGGATADASTIYSGPINFDVGASGQKLYSIPLTGSATFVNFLSKAATTSSATVHRFHYRAILASGAAGVNVATVLSGNIGHLRLFQPGALLTGAAASAAPIGGRAWRSTANGGAISSALTGLAPFSHEYALFRFTTAAGLTDYGWVQLSYSVGTDPGSGPDLTIIDYAWNNSGALLPAGDTGVPEPSTAGLMGLGALALGAAGLRRWRKSRQAAKAAGV